MARLSARTSSAAREPTSVPRRLLGTAVSLSTINRQGARSPVRLAGIGRATRDGPDLATFHSAFQAEIASTYAWSRLASRLFATASD